MNLSEISKLPDKGSQYSPTHRLWIGGDNFTENLRTASITYTTENGGSGCQLALGGDLRDYDNAEVRLSLGYGDEVVPYFVGTLQRPQHFGRLDYTSANAFGRYKLMADQVIGEDVNYHGFTLRNALADLTYRAQYKRGEVEIRGGQEITIDTDETFVWSNTLGEIAASLMDKSLYVAMDQPFGKRLFMKRPRPGVHGPVKEIYQPHEFVLDGFELNPGSEVSYRTVIVQLVNSEGEEIGLYKQDVGTRGRFKPPILRSYILPDFLGTPDQANQEASDTAKYLRLGDWGFSFTIPLNPTLQLYDILRVSQVRRGLRYSYKCQISDEINVEYSPATMTAPGVATMALTGRALTVENGVEVG